MGECLKRLTRIPLPLNGQVLNLGPNLLSNDVVSFRAKSQNVTKMIPKPLARNMKKQKHERGIISRAQKLRFAFCLLNDLLLALEF